MANSIILTSMKEESLLAMKYNAAERPSKKLVLRWPSKILRYERLRRGRRSFALLNSTTCRVNFHLPTRVLRENIQNRWDGDVAE